MRIRIKTILQLCTHTGLPLVWEWKVLKRNGADGTKPFPLTASHTQLLPIIAASLHIPLFQRVEATSILLCSSKLVSFTPSDEVPLLVLRHHTTRSTALSLASNSHKWGLQYFALHRFSTARNSVSKCLKKLFSWQRGITALLIMCYPLSVLHCHCTHRLSLR